MTITARHVIVMTVVTKFLKIKQSHSLLKQEPLQPFK